MATYAHHVALSVQDESTRNRYIAGLIQGVSIFILNQIYDRAAMWLTWWENHRFDSAFDSALVVKIFAFQYCNCYISIFYSIFVDSRVENAFIQVRHFAPMRPACGHVKL